MIRLIVLLLLACCSYTNAQEALVLTETGGFRHGVIDTAYNALNNLAQTRGWTFTRTDESQGYFTTASLANYDVVVFFFTTGDGNPGILDSNEKAALQQFIQNGGGYVGVHSAADTYQTQWPWYHQLVGAGFTSHPTVQTATVRIEDKSHGTVSHLPHRWTITDEWYNYNFALTPRSQLHVVATVDESTYSGGGNGLDHPIIWCHNFDGGRSWYTGLGHEAALWSDAAFLDHVMKGIQWAEGEVSGDCSASLESNYVKQTIYSSPNQPVGGAVPGDSSDERVFFIERITGNVLLYKPSTGQTVITQTIPVFGGLEDGLMGITFDPDFVNQPYVYFFYSPVGINENRISRFTMSGDTFSLASEVVVLSIPTQRDECCHSGGHMKFEPGTRDLWLTVGDNTNPFASSGYSPIDERSGRSAWDAQKSSANTNDLRGSILRITVNTDGTYTCPAGNLFLQDATHRCEIYVMGNRNPYRMAINPYHPAMIYWGEVGPDAGSASSNRGPAGHDEVNKAATPGNYGWPYCLANNLAYNDYDFATSQSGALFDCANPVNDSPNNNGASNLPPARSAFVWYSGSSSSNSEAVPSGGGRTAEAPYMHFHDTNRQGPCALPSYFDNSLIFAEWSRDKLRQYIMDANGDLLHAIPLFDSFQFLHPIDIFTANDGSLYVVEYGTDFSGSGARLSQICYTAGTASVSCSFAADPTAGTVPLTVNLDASASFHSQGAALSYEWDFNGDQIVDATSISAQHIYSSAGDKSITLRVYETANPNIESVCGVNIAAGNNLPAVTLLQPALEGGIYDWGNEIVIEASVFDVEDGSTPASNGIDCSNVILETSTGHEDHAHGFFQTTGCIATSQISGAGGHDEDLDWIYWVAAARYTDQGATGVSPALGESFRQLHPRKRQAEKFSAAANLICEANNQLARFNPVPECSEVSSDIGGGLNIGWIDDGQWLRYDNYNPHNVQDITFRVASNKVGAVVGHIDVRLDDPSTGTIIATAAVPGTGGWQNWVDATVPLSEANQIFDIDLGLAQSVSKIRLDSTGSANDYPRAYQIYAAGIDGVFGSPIRPVHRAEPNTNTAADQTITLCQQVDNVRYLRIMQTGDHPAWWWSLHEIYVFDELDMSIPIAAVSASREFTWGGEVANNAIDADPTTRWATGEVQNGGPYNLYLVFRAEAGGPTSAMFNLNWFRFDNGLGISRPSQAPVLAHAINSAGSAVAADGISYDADRDFSASSTATVTNAIAGTTSDALYQSERWANAGSFVYTLAVTPGETYEIIFKLAEIWTGITGPGQRVFAILVDGVIAYDNLDIYAAVGSFTAYDLTYTYVAADASLEITFQSITQNAKCNAIIVQSAGTGVTPGLSCTDEEPLPGCSSDAECDDGNVCDGLESCNLSTGQCQAGNVLNCDDSDACTVDTCHATLGCQYSSLNCDDGLACTVDSCDTNTGCQNQAIVCDDNDVCTSDSCIEPTGTCQYDPIVTEPVLTFALNCGPATSSFSASDGYTYQTDQYYLNGNTAQFNDPITGSSDDNLYQTERWAAPALGQLNYEFAVTVGKQYRITLKFAEIYNGITGAGQRVFDVRIEGSLIYDDLDLYALVGPDVAYDIIHIYTATDTTLDIDLISQVENAKIGAILIEEITTCTT